MNTSDLLEQLLRAGQGSPSQSGPGAASGQGGLGGLLGGLLGGGSAGAGAGGLGGLLGGLLGGSALGGANQGGGLGGVLGGSSQGRSGAGGYAALASLGMMAFQAYQAWQQQQASAPQQAPRTVDQLSGPEAQNHSHAILRALIAAAKADGRIDEREQQMISAEVGRHTDDPQLQAWLDQEVAKPLNAAEVAQSADDEPGIAAEMYLASVLVVDDQQDAERSYLDELAAALRLDPQLQLQLEQQAKGGNAGSSA